MKSELCQHGSDPDGCLCCMDNRLEEKVVSYQAEIARLKEFIKPHETIEEYQKAWEELDDERKAEIERLKAENAKLREDYMNEESEMCKRLNDEANELNEKCLAQAAQIELLRGALEPFAITLGSPDSNRRIRPDEDVAIGVKASDVFGAIEALSASADSGLEEVRGLVKALEEIANRVNNEGDDSQATVADCGHIAREALAAHQKRGK